MGTTNNKAAPRNGTTSRTPRANYKQSGRFNKTALCDQLFVIDYGSQYPRKLTEAEYRRFQSIIKMIMSGPVSFEEKTVNSKKGIHIWREPILRKYA